MAANLGALRAGASQFTDDGVYRDLARLLDDLTSGLADLDCAVARYSDEFGGIHSQVQRSARQWGDALAGLSGFLAIPEEAFAPGNEAVAASYGVVHIYTDQVHPRARCRAYMGSLVVCGGTLFCRVETSSTARMIAREDGPDEVAYAVLVLGIMRHLSGRLRQMWWSEDSRRITRDPVDFAMMMREAAERGLQLRTGQALLDPRRDHIVAAVQGGQGHQDSLTRIQAMTGGRLQALTEACPISEDQLPHGVRHARTADGRKVKRNKVNVAEADSDWHPALVGALRLLAAGKSYVEIGLFLAECGLPRRGQKQPRGATWSELAEDRAALSDTTRRLFVNSARTKPGLERLYLGKLELWETGIYPYRVANDFPHRGATVGGFAPNYDGPRDAKGFFDLELNWGIPLAGFDSDEERQTVIEACRRRILSERRTPRASKGLDAADGTVRVLGGGFDRWDATQEADERWPGDTTRWGVTTRTHNSGTDTFVVVHYPTAMAVDDQGHERGLWSFTHRPDQHIAGTFRSAAYCASVAAAMRRAVINGLLDPDACAPIAREVFSDPLRERRVHLEAQVAAQESKSTTLRSEVAGFQSRAARLEGQGRVHEAEELWDKGDAAKQRLRSSEHTLEALKEAVRSLSALPVRPEAMADLSLVAYLQAALERALRANGRGPLAAQQVALQLLRNRRFAVRGDAIEWAATLDVPLADGGRAQVQLAGTLENVRNRTGKALARPDHIARYVLAEGQDLDEVALDQGVLRATLLKQRLMPWLVDHGVTSRGLKCALVDHPLPKVQRAIWEHLTGWAPTPLLPGPEAFRRHLIATYTNPGGTWGDAACLDELGSVREALTALGRGAMTVLDLAHMLGLDDRTVREWASPHARSGGPTRPRYLEFADRDHTSVRACRCPHPGCGRRPADHAVLLPEVAATGCGVICRRCRRAPVAAWAHIQFPVEYLARPTRSSDGRSLRSSRQTIIEAGSGRPMK